MIELENGQMAMFPEGEGTAPHDVGKMWIVNPPMRVVADLKDVSGPEKEKIHQLIAEKLEKAGFKVQVKKGKVYSDGPPTSIMNFLKNFLPPASQFAQFDKNKVLIKLSPNPKNFGFSGTVMPLKKNPKVNVVTNPQFKIDDFVVKVGSDIKGRVSGSDNGKVIVQWDTGDTTEEQPTSLTKSSGPQLIDVKEADHGFDWTVYRYSGAVYDWGNSDSEYLALADARRAYNEMVQEETRYNPDRYGQGIYSDESLARLREDAWRHFESMKIVPTIEEIFNDMCDAIEDETGYCDENIVARFLGMDEDDEMENPKFKRKARQDSLEPEEEYRAWMHKQEGMGMMNPNIYADVRDPNFTPNPIGAAIGGLAKAGARVGARAGMKAAKYGARKGAGLAKEGVKSGARYGARKLLEYSAPPQGYAYNGPPYGWSWQDLQNAKVELQELRKLGDPRYKDLEEQIDEVQVYYDEISSNPGDNMQIVEPNPPKKTMFFEPKYKKYAKIITVKSIPKAKESLNKLSAEWKNADREKKRRIIKAATLAANRAVGMTKRKKRPLRQKTKDEKLKIAKLYREWIKSHSLSSNPNGDEEVPEMEETQPIEEQEEEIQEDKEMYENSPPEQNPPDESQEASDEANDPEEEETKEEEETEEQEEEEEPSAVPVVNPPEAEEKPSEHLLKFLGWGNPVGTDKKIKIYRCVKCNKTFRGA